jgi:hypothetical protein
MFKGLTALVTGSTSGIGLGIATAFAAKGANVVLNGFGDAAAIETIRAKLAADHGVQVRYDGADLSQQARSSNDAQARTPNSAPSISWSTMQASSLSPRWTNCRSTSGTILAQPIRVSFHAIRLALPK